MTGIHKSSDLAKDMDGLERAVEKACRTIDGLRSINRELVEALRQAADFHCPGCGNGNKGCAVIHYHGCHILALLKKAEGRKLGLNGQPTKLSLADAREMGGYDPDDNTWSGVPARFTK